MRRKIPLSLPCSKEEDGEFFAAVATSQIFAAHLLLEQFSAEDFRAST